MLAITKKLGDFSRVTGEKGFFDTRIVFVDEIVVRGEPFDRKQRSVISALTPSEQEARGTLQSDARSCISFKAMASVADFELMGKPVDEYFKSPLSGGHPQSVLGVLKGTYDAAFTWTSKDDGFGNLRQMMNQGLLKREDIRIIWTSDPLPSPPVVIRKDVPADMRADMLKLFTGLKDVDIDSTIFRPACDTAELNRCPRESIVNAYDNTLRWDAARKVFDAKGEVMAVPVNGNIQLLYYRADLYAAKGLKVKTSSYSSPP